MSIIYSPSGPAGEYSPWAVNLYRGCAHGCRYCYAPAALRMDAADFFGSPQPRRDVIKKLEVEATKFAKAHPGALVLLSFSSDPYQPIEAAHQLTRRALAVLLKHDLRVAILTKAADLALRDLDLLTGSPLRHWFGVTLTTMSAGRALVWEPRAELPMARLRAVTAAGLAGVPNWVSLEPVIYPEDTIGIIHHLAGRVRHFAVGRLNHLRWEEVRAVDPSWVPINWPAFRDQAISKLEHHGYRRVDRNLPDEPGLTYYVKRDLGQAR